jgi:hypothetical protein
MNKSSDIMRSMERIQFLDHYFQRAEQRALYIDDSFMLVSPAFPPHLQALVRLARPVKAV